MIMTMELLNEIMDAMVRGTLIGICASFWIMGLAAIWKWFLGILKRFFRWLFPPHTAPKGNDTDNN